MQPTVRTATRLALGIAAAASLCTAPSALRAAAARPAAQHAPRTQGYLGIQFRDLTDEQVNALHLKNGRGAEIGMVDHDGPAGKAGLKPGDIIVSVNGQNVTNAEMLHRMIRDAGAGTTLNIAIYRQGAPLKLTATLADPREVERQALARMSQPPELPSTDDEDTVVIRTFQTQALLEAPQQAALPATHQSFLSAMLHMTPFTGLAVEEMGPQLATFFGAPAGQGLLVDTVAPNSPAAAAGLQAGDVVWKADALVLKSTGDWTKHLHAVKGKAVTLTILRNKQTMQVTIQPDLKRHSLLEWPRMLNGAE